MKKGVFFDLRTRISQTGQHFSGLRADLLSRVGRFRRRRSASEQRELAEDFNHVLMAWGIADAVDIPGVVRVLRIRFVVFAVPVAVCVITALLRQDFASYLALAFVSLPCLLGIVTTAWRISILTKRRFLSLPRWLLSCGGLLRP